MKNFTILFLILLFFALVGCNSKKQNAEKKYIKEVLNTQELKVLNISLKVPKTSVITDTKDQFTIVMNPEIRNIRQFTIKELHPAMPTQIFTDFFSFDNNAKLYYDVYEESGGNGGMEYHLNGILEFDDKQYYITAMDQSEMERGNPKFCFDYLATIQLLSHE